MSPRTNVPRDRKDTLSDLAQDAVGVHMLRVRRPSAARRLLAPNAPGRRVHWPWRALRERRPIRGFLVPHRRMFGTRHKHKQPYRG